MPDLQCMRFLSSADKVHRHDSALWASMTAEQRKNQSQQWRAELLAATEVWCQNLEDGPLKTQGQKNNRTEVELPPPPL